MWSATVNSSFVRVNVQSPDIGGGARASRTMIWTSVLVTFGSASNETVVLGLGKDSCMQEMATST